MALSSNAVFESVCDDYSGVFFFVFFSFDRYLLSLHANTKDLSGIAVVGRKQIAVFGSQQIAPRDGHNGSRILPISVPVSSCIVSCYPRENKRRRRLSICMIHLGVGHVRVKLCSPMLEERQFVCSYNFLKKRNPAKIPPKTISLIKSENKKKVDFVFIVSKKIGVRSIRVP